LELTTMPEVGQFVIHVYMHIMEDIMEVMAFRKAMPKRVGSLKSNSMP